MTDNWDLGYVALLRALRHWHLAVDGSEINRAAVKIELDRVDSMLAGLAPGPGANEIQRLLRALRRCQQHQRDSSSELISAFHAARHACATLTPPAP